MAQDDPRFPTPRRASRGLHLAGPQGCGKTTFAEAAAKMFGPDTPRPHDIPQTTWDRLSEYARALLVADDETGESYPTARDLPPTTSDLVARAAKAYAPKPPLRLGELPEPRCMPLAEAAEAAEIRATRLPRRSDLTLSNQLVIMSALQVVMHEPGGGSAKALQARRLSDAIEATRNELESK